MAILKMWDVEVPIFIWHRGIEIWSYARATYSIFRNAIPRIICLRPRRCAVLLLGGNKTGDNRWYEKNVPLADKLYKTHLHTLAQEDEKNG